MLPLPPPSPLKSRLSPEKNKNGGLSLSARKTWIALTKKAVKPCSVLNTNKAQMKEILVKTLALPAFLPKIALILIAIPMDPGIISSVVPQELPLLPPLFWPSTPCDLVNS